MHESWIGSTRERVEERCENTRGAGYKWAPRMERYKWAPRMERYEWAPRTEDYPAGNTKREHVPSTRSKGINSPVSIKDLRNLVAYYTINPTLLNATDITILRRSLLYDLSYLYPLTFSISPNHTQYLPPSSPRLHSSSLCCVITVTRKGYNTDAVHLIVLSLWQGHKLV